MPCFRFILRDVLDTDRKSLWILYQRQSSEWKIIANVQETMMSGVVQPFLGTFFALKLV